MNFFQHQDTARRNTKRLVLFLILAVLSLIAMTNVLIIAVIYFFQFRSSNNSATYDQNANPVDIVNQIFSVELLGSISLAVIAVVVLGSLYKISQLSGGGRRVAEAMGGRLLNTNTRNANERKILNVVEEMAIASGTPVPPVYLIDDTSINAFAAGFKPKDAVIGVTQGCIELLNRDELQGVMAHEFSHILHGDMRLNIRLVGLLHGILVIGLIGYFIMRSSLYSGAMQRSRDKNSLPFLALGVGLIVLGYAGTFFGNIIKSAVSRQREFLADASAVQFTRNPEGISGALKKIGGYPTGSIIQSPNAPEFSHMFFGQGVVTAFSNIMATHPPLPERIRRIEPNWNGRFPAVNLANTARTIDSEEGASHFAGTDANTSTYVNETNNIPVTPTSAIDSIGQPVEAQVKLAKQIINEIPASLYEAAHDPYSARAIVFCLLLDKKNHEVMNKQLTRLREKSDPNVLKVVRNIAREVGILDQRFYLPLLDLAIPTLRELSPTQYNSFKENVVALIKADQKVDLFEWALYRILSHNLEPQRHTSANKSLSLLDEECRVLLSLVAQTGNDDPQAANAAFDEAMQILHLGTRTMMKASLITLPQLDQLLEKLGRIKPLQKPTLLKAIAACITHDKQVTTKEAELFRAISDSLDCPVPLLLPNQTLS